MTITINQGDSQWAYFGCFLNVNDPNLQVNGTPIWKAFTGTHHCLVAEIAYAGAPIQVAGGITPTPESSDQLAQRNLQVTTSDNPGPALAHRVPQTFDIRPSDPPPTFGALAGRPDELLIEWGDVPVGSTARIYWPAASSADVIELASWMYGVHPLAAVDAHTIEVRTFRGATYVPIPQGTGPSLAGLFTIDLPQTVNTGQEFNVVVRRIGKRLRRVPTPPPPPPEIQIAAARETRRRRGAPQAFAETPPAAPLSVRLDYERYIVGSFQVKIPVSTSQAMLPAEETTLAILKARLEGWSPSDRWYPVLLRYVDQIAGRVDGLGGDAGAIPPSLIGSWPGRYPDPAPFAAFTGKVLQVAFDGVGDLSGFVLDYCREHRAFASREKEIGELLVRALKEHLRLTVVTCGKERKIVRLLLKA